MRIIKLGDRGDEVKKLQKLLHLLDDGIFGKLTQEAVKNFQKEHGLFADGIVGPKTWSILLAQDFKKSTRNIKEIIVHCTATKEGLNQTVEQIKKYHTAKPPMGRGWSDIGYHYVVYLDGSIHEGRNINIAGAHCTNHNTNSIGVVYVGGLDFKGNAKDTRTPAQKEGLLKLLKELKKLYPKATIHGHREYANKACPCFDAKNEYKNIT